MRLPRLRSRAGPPLACREVVELITEYLEGVLPAGERARFEAHIGGCPDCAAYLGQMRATIEITGRLTVGDLEPHVATALLEAFRGWRRDTANGSSF